jgi:hypothetical protein
MASLQSIIGGVGNEDRGSGRRPLLHLTDGRIRTNQPGLYEVGQPGGTASFRNGIDDMLEQIGTKAASNICRLNAQLVHGNDRVLEEVHRRLPRILEQIFEVRTALMASSTPIIIIKVSGVAFAMAALVPGTCG